jgi:hypothetical protein
MTALGRDRLRELLDAVLGGTDAPAGGMRRAGSSTFCLSLLGHTRKAVHECPLAKLLRSRHCAYELGTTTAEWPQRDLLPLHPKVCLAAARVRENYVQRRHFLALGAGGMLGLALGVRPWSPMAAPSTNAQERLEFGPTHDSQRSAPMHQGRPRSDTFPESALSEPPSPHDDDLAGIPSDSTPSREPSAEDAYSPSRAAEPPPQPRAADESTADVDSNEESPVPVKLRVICRDALGLAPPRPTTAAHAIRTLTLHHTEVSLEDNALVPERLRRHQSYHLQQGWTDIAYHYGVDLAGNIYELRDPETAGDTQTTYDPSGHLLVVCEGDFNRQRPTDPLLTSVAQLFAFAASFYGVPLSTLGGHRDHAVDTTCPGDNLQRELSSLRREAERLLDGFTLDLAVACGVEGQRLVSEITAGL